MLSGCLTRNVWIWAPEKGLHQGEPTGAVWHTHFWGRKVRFSGTAITCCQKLYPYSTSWIPASGSAGLCKVTSVVGRKGLEPCFSLLPPSLTIQSLMKLYVLCKFLCRCKRLVGGVYTSGEPTQLLKTIPEKSGTENFSKETWRNRLCII